jgi:hypothetical protein
VAGGALYVDVRVTWTPQAQDAYDIEIVDPDGAVVASSGNSVGEGESALFAPRKVGRYVLRLLPFAAVAAQYDARVSVASPAN